MEVTENDKVTDVNGDCGETDVITPWTVQSQNETGVDYDKLISK